MGLKGPEAQFLLKSWCSVQIIKICEFIDFPIISSDFTEIAEIPRRARWPRTTCPGLVKQSKLHRFRRGKSSQGSPEPARIIKNRIFGIYSEFNGILQEIVKFSDFLVNSTRIWYFGGLVLEWLYFLWNFNDSGHPICLNSIKFPDFHLI